MKLATIPQQAPLQIIDIGPRERPWANKKMQHGLGRFRYEQTAGLYLAEHMPMQDLQLLQNTFAKIPEPLLACARSLGLTLATCQGLTPNGNASTTYADFRSYRLCDISPHIVMGSQSLTRDLVLPHLVHELCHLYYAMMPLDLRLAWAKLLEDEAKSCREVTCYAQRHRDSWLQCSEPLNHIARVRFDQYAAETFCETAAALIAPSYLSPETTVDLTARRQLLAIAGLTFVAECHS